MQTSAKKFTITVALATALVVTGVTKSQAANELTGGLLGGGAGAGIGAALGGYKGAAIGGVLGLALGAFAANRYSNGGLFGYGNKPSYSQGYAPAPAYAPAPTYAPAYAPAAYTPPPPPPRYSYTAVEPSYVYAPPPKPTYVTPPSYGYRYGDAAAQRAELTMAVQSELSALGYNPGPVDGINGPRTSSAIRGYQSRYGFIVDGRVSLGLLDHIRVTRSKLASGEPATSGTPLTPGTPAPYSPSYN